MILSYSSKPCIKVAVSNAILYLSILNKAHTQKAISFVKNITL